MNLSGRVLPESGKNVLQKHSEEVADEQMKSLKVVMEVLRGPES